MTAKQKQTVEDCCVYIVRKEDHKQWMVNAERGDLTAELCIQAVDRVRRAIPNELGHCCCCDTRFRPDDNPAAFIVLIPVNSNLEMITAHASAVCSECGTHDAQWLIEQGVRKEWLAPISPQVH
jgi:hypothetical protein